MSASPVDFIVTPTLNLAIGPRILETFFFILSTVGKGGSCRLPGISVLFFSSFLFHTSVNCCFVELQFTASSGLSLFSLFYNWDILKTFPMIANTG